MKLATLLTALALAVTLNTVYAEEATSIDETYAYCTEQAERDGIENVDEKKGYIQACVESFATPSDEIQPSGE